MKRATIFAGAIGAIAASLTVLGCPTFTGALCDNGACDPITTTSSIEGGAVNEGGGGADGMVGTVEGGKPLDCDLTKDPGDSTACITESVGVFVDANSGADTNIGTRKAPFKTITAAIGAAAGMKRVYVCAGQYGDNVSLDSMHASSVYGGFACGLWTYAATNMVKVGPSVGYPLRIANIPGALVVADIEFDAPMGSSNHVNSIAAFVSSSPKITLERVTLMANTGVQGAQGDPGAMGALLSSAPTAGSMNGNGGDGTNGGAQQVCTCANGGTSKGGKGGDNVAGNASNGSSGETAQATPIPNDGLHDGAGSTSAACAGTSVNGHSGSAAPNQNSAPGATKLGTLDQNGWTPAPGTIGLDGQAGQGGGGGGGNMGGGGGGACGGCGGGGGKPGGGGGASVALLALDSPVTIVACSFVPGVAGPGGTGGGSGSGIGGGTKGNAGGNGCQGGPGGAGGNGGAGGGGAGGVSAAILYKGTMPSFGGDTKIMQGTLGAKGQGGDPGNDDGIPGQQGDAIAAP